ncbi:MAG: ABC transporter permease [Chloroflexales bacterium]|nr:ABC transporter permease [Chloroflexales bacterium]
MQSHQLDAAPSRELEPISTERSAKRQNPLQRIRCRLDTLGLLALVFLIWEGLGRLGLINDNLLPLPSLLAVTALELAQSGLLFANAFSSVSRVFVGFGIAAVLSVASGVTLGMFPALGRRLAPLLDLLRPIPPIAWIPIAILWFGLGNTAAVFIVAIGAFFPIFLSTYSGISGVKQAHVNAARCLGASPRLIITDILFPAALPQILTGLRVGVGIAWTSVIAAEMVGTRAGLGYAIQLNRTMLETEAVIVNMIVIGFVGWTMNYLVQRLEQRLTRWNRDTLAVG